MASGSKVRRERPCFVQQLVVFAAVLVEEVLDQRGNIFLAVAQRRQRQVDHVEAVVQILAEAPFLHQLLQIGVGGGHDAHVDADGFGRAQRHELALLDHAQQLGLGLERDGADLVEEDGPAVGDFEVAFARGHGAGEGAFDVAEERRFQQIRRNGAGVHGHEGMLGAGRVARGSRWRSVPCRCRFRR